MTAVDRTLESLELIKVVKEDEPDEVDKLLCKNGVLYNDESEIDYQDEHESGVDWDKYNEDGGEDR